MAYDPQLKPEDKKSLFGVIIHSFFVVPFLIAVFSILLFAAVRVLTMEKRSVYDYLQDVKEGGSTKRWQGAFNLLRVISENKRWQGAYDLSRVVADQGSVPVDDKFVDEMDAAFAASKHDDDRVRQYLALAMARSGNQKFVDALLADIAEEKDENLYAIITALGILKNNKATDALLKYMDDPNPRIRLAAVIALGNIGDANAVSPLKHMLSDNEPNVVWDSAIALAKMGDRSGKDIIMKLLDREYLKGFPNVGAQQQSRIMQVAILASAKWKDPEVDTVLQKLFESDKNMNVRVFARQVLELK